MIVANIKSNADLKAKKDLQKQLLELEIANEGVRQQRQKESGVKDLEAKKLPDYKTTAEVLKDKVSLEKRALDNLIELGFNYTDAGQLVNFLTLNDRVADFIANYKTIKKDVLEGYDKTLINIDFMKNVLNNFFDDLDANLGKKFSKDIGFETSLFQDPTSILPDERFIENIIKALEKLANRISEEIPVSRNQLILNDTALELLRLFKVLKEIIPTEKMLIDIKDFFTQNERNTIVKNITRAYKRLVPIDDTEVRDIDLRLTFLSNEPILREDLIANYFNKLTRQLSGLSDKRRRDLLLNSYKDYVKTISKKGVDFENREKEIDALIKQVEEAYSKNLIEEVIDEVKSEEIPLKDGSEDVLPPLEQELAQLLDVRNENIAYADELLSKISSPSQYRGLLTTLINKYKGNPDFENEVNNAVIFRNRIKKNVGENNKKDIQELVKNVVLKQTQLSDYAYNPKERQVGFIPIRHRNEYNKEVVIKNNYPAGMYGLGANPKLLSKLKKHFKDDEKLLKKVAKVLTEDSSSDEEEMKEVNRHIKATDKVDKVIEKEVGKGVSFKATRIPTSKVGKGVKLEKEDNPTYRQFGKYVIHIPHLLNNNTANFKYPSLGSIPTIKPLTVSTDYKDLLLDVLQTGKLNKKELERLPQNEIKHFERVAIGAGLVEQLGMKIGNTEEDKADAKRFEVLRGEYLAGNNNEKMIKELRQLITKFINSGRLHKTEGLNLLLELSTV